MSEQHGGRGGGEIDSLASAEGLALSGVVAVKRSLDRVVISGGDAEAFLQGQLSQDLETITVGQSARTLLLSPQGKLVSWPTLYRAAAQEYHLVVGAGLGATVEERLRRFMIRVAVEVSVDEVVVWTLRGPRSEEAVAKVLSENPGAYSVDSSWRAPGGLEDRGFVGVDLFGVATPDSATDGLPDDLRVAGPELLELLDIRFVRPAFGFELDDKTIPAAAKIVDTSVSFTKGCYVGQELVARLDSRGAATPKSLKGIRGGHIELSAGMNLHQLGAEPDESVGQIIRAANSPEVGWVATAYIHRRASDATVLKLENGAEVRIAEAQIDDVSNGDLPNDNGLTGDV